jgi:hypothetical protein
MSARLERIGAFGGIFFVVLQLIGQSLIQVGGTEPSFSAPADEIVQFFEARDDVLFGIGGYVSTLGLVALLGFVASLWVALNRAEGGPGWLSFATAASGIGVVAMLLAGGGAWFLAVFRIDEGLDPQIARLLFDMGNFTFASSWVLFGAFTLAVSMATLTYEIFAKWLGWSGVVVGVGLILAPIIWTSPAAFTPYMLFWLWLITVSVVMLRRARE